LNDDRSYYASHSRVTDPGEMAPALQGLPRDIAGMKRVAHRLVIHFRLGDPRAVGIGDDRLGEIDSRYAETMLARLLELDDRPLSEPREPKDRIVGCCRDFTVLFLAMARSFGIPARGRVGFATYFYSGAKIDHEVAEVWDEAEGRWRLVDPQLDDAHVDPNDDAGVDPTDLPRDRFMDAGTVWRVCRAGDDDPDTFRARPDVDLEMTRGWPYISHNLVLDLAALNKTETLLWDVWGLAGKGLAWKSVTPEEIELLDRVADVVAAAEPDLAEVRRLYADEELLRVPPKITSFNPLTFAPREVALR
jgi:hypothetical protein